MGEKQCMLKILHFKLQYSALIVMASFLQRSGATTHFLFQIIRRPNPKPLGPFPKPFYTKPPPLKFSNTIHSHHLEPYLLQIQSIFTTKLRSQSILPEISTILNPHRFSSTSPEISEPKLRHQEITGPTVEPDNSPLANETREVLESLLRSVYNLNSALAVLGVAHLALGAWIAYDVPTLNAASIQGFAAFAFPFSLAFLLRRSVKPMVFFQKMEKQGRLQVLTYALQVSKSLQLMFVRMRIVCVGCVVGVTAGSLVTLWLR